MTAKKCTTSEKSSSAGGDVKGWDPAVVTSARIYMDHLTKGAVYRMPIASEHES